MSNNTEIKFIDNSNEWINWIEESIVKKQIIYYDYKYFNNIQGIGLGRFGKVYRANWNNSHNYLALKLFFNFDTIIKEIVNELKLHREMDFHENIIRFYGITSEIQSDDSKRYLLVMEYADSGTLRNYLSEYFENLTWNDKLNLALQLANAISYLHDKEIVYRNLHSNNILVNKNTIKLADFGLSERIEELSNAQSKLLFGMVTYIDPQIFNRRRDSNNQLQIYTLSKKSDIYSIGILLWEISSGRPPFSNEPYDVGLVMEILQGLREKPILNTPKDYIKIYTDCWNNEPNNRPTINQVVIKLNIIISEIQLNDYNEISENVINYNSQISQIIQNFSRIDINEIDPSISTDLIMNDFEIMVVEIISLFENIEINMRKCKIIKYLDNHNVTSQEIYNWLLNNQDNSDSVFLLGVFNHFGIEINVDEQKAFELYQKSSNLKNTLGITSLGYCYEKGIGTFVNKLKAFEFYQKAANLGSARGLYNLGNCYLYGIGVLVNGPKAIELFQMSASLGNLLGMCNLGWCYKKGIGTNIDYQKAFELYKKATNLGNYLAQYNLAFFYKDGIGIKKDISQAICLFKKSAEQEYQNAKYKLIE
ncbi:kinase-like domain-containing protein [Rhizophagus diaphanus]|nr:kinase-like domain-containing protein [Rhizophagus diaphanus] [Rhizophagus sp. MUCL 43196]